MPRISTIPAERLEELTATLKAKAFLGREFLTWLWYEAELLEGTVNLTSLNYDHTYSVRFWIDDRVILESVNAQTHSHTIKGGDPAHSPEALIALRQGKTVRELKLGFEIDGVGPFVVTMGSDGVSDSGLCSRTLQLPESDDDESQSQPLATRLELIRTFADCFDSFFRRFLDARLQPNWEESTLPKIRTWMQKQPIEQSGAIH